MQFLGQMFVKELIFENLKLKGFCIDLKLIDKLLGMLFEIFIFYLIHVLYSYFFISLKFLKHGEQEVIFCD